MVEAQDNKGVPVIYDAWGDPYINENLGKGFEHDLFVKDRDYDYSIKGLAPAGLWSAMQSAYTGDVSALQSYFEQSLSRDGHLHSLDQRRRRGVSGLDFELRPYADRPGWELKDGKPAKAEDKYEDEDIETCNMVNDILWRIPNIQEHIETMLDAVGKGFSVLQINWVDDGGLLRPFMRSVPQRKFTFAKDNPEDVLTDEWPTLLTDEAPSYGEEISPHRYIVSCYRDRNVEIWKCGLMWASILFYLRKNQGWQQNMSTGERYANPPLVGWIAPEAWNAQVVSTVKTAMRQWGPGNSVVIPGTGEPLKDVDVVKGVPRGAYLSQPEVNLKLPSDFWKMTRDDCDRELSKLWTLGNLTTDVLAAGSKAAEEGQRRTEIEDTRKPDVDWLACGPLYRLVELIVYHNRGPEAARRLPVLTAPGLEPEPDMQARAEKFKSIGDTNWDGVRGAPEEVRDLLDIPEMEPPEEPELPPQLPPQEPPVPPEQPRQPPPGQEQEQQQPPEEKPPFPPKKIEACACESIFMADATPGTETAFQELRDRIAAALAKTEPLNEAAAEQIRDRVTAHLLRLKNAPKTPAAFQKKIMRVIDARYDELAAEFESAGMGEWFEDTYKHYKTTDRAVWPKKGPPASAITFGAADERMAKHIGETANWHFSKFTDNETFRRPMESFLTKTYATEGAQLNVRNPKVVKAFAKQLGTTTRDLAEHEIDRIARTTVARAREQARIMQMRDAGIKRAVVRTHPDACPICAQYEGRVLDVQSEVQWIDHLATLKGEAWEKAVRDHGKNAIKGVPPHEFDMGAASPLYHPHCRCGVDMK